MINYGFDENSIVNVKKHGLSLLNVLCKNNTVLFGLGTYVI